jgi:hypothetical protein
MANDCWGPDMSRPTDSLFKGSTKQHERHEDGRVCERFEDGWFIKYDERDAHEDRRREVTESVSCTSHHYSDKSTSEWSDRGEFGFPHTGSEMGKGLYDRLWSIDEGPHEQKVSRVCNIMDEAQTLYKRKSAGYKTADGDPADVLGIKGQFSDINRKFWKLKGMLWDETIPIEVDKGMGESAEEVLMDFIGHAALTIDMLRRQRGHGEEGNVCTCGEFSGSSVVMVDCPVHGKVKKS